MNSIALKTLKKILKKQVFSDPKTLRKVSLDASRIQVIPEALICPENKAELKKVLQIANRYLNPITLRGGGSSTTGSATPSSSKTWVLDLSNWKKLSIDKHLGVLQAEAGASIQKIQRFSEKHGWFYPPDPSSKAYCTIGGTIATNAGGLRGAKYGVTRDYVLALEGFLPNGTFLKLGRPLKKFAVGYNLRDLWIGSEGTLGIITKASLKLIPKPESRWTALISLPSDSTGLNTGLHFMKAEYFPSALEFLDQQTLDCLKKGFPQNNLLKTSKKGSLLLLEIDGHPAEVKAKVSSIKSFLKIKGFPFKSTYEAIQAEKFWQLRRDCSQAMYTLGDTKINEDVVIPPQKYKTFFKSLKLLEKKIQLPMPTFGHLADGNFHVHFMFNHTDKKQINRLQSATHELMKKVVQLGGAISGEHGIGLSKSAFFTLQHNSEVIKTMQIIKKSFDPKNILNPHKILTPTKMKNLTLNYTHPFPWQRLGSNQPFFQK